MLGIVTVNEDILFYAFRYTIGKKNYSVQEVIEAIKENADNLSDQIRNAMIQEIDEKWQINQLGMDVDKRGWLEVRQLLLNTKD